MLPQLNPTTSQQLETLKTAAKGSYIFHGPSHVGKFTTAIWLAQRLNCQGDAGTQCSNCRLIANRNYADLIIIEPEDKSIGIAQVQDLVQRLSLSPYYPLGRRVVIIDQADTLTTEAQNGLLKLLEEPPEATVIILVAAQLDQLLVTINSRCAKLYFNSLSLVQLQAHLQNTVSLKPELAQQLAMLSQGAIGLALNLAADQGLRQRYQAAADLAQNAAQTSAFERLVMAAKLAESPGLAENFIKFLAAGMRQRLRSQLSAQGVKLAEQTRQLAAIERYQRHRQANVNLKAALESLVLEL